MVRRTGMWRARTGGAAMALGRAPAGGVVQAIGAGAAAVLSLARPSYWCAWWGRYSGRAGCPGARCRRGARGGRQPVDEALDVSEHLRARTGPSASRPRDGRNGRGVPCVRRPRWACAPRIQLANDRHARSVRVASRGVRGRRPEPVAGRVPAPTWALLMGMAVGITGQPCGPTSGSAGRTGHGTDLGVCGLPRPWLGSWR